MQEKPKDRAAFAAKDSTPTEYLVRLSHDGSPAVRGAAGSNGDLPDEDRARLHTSTVIAVHRGLAKNPKNTREQFEALQALNDAEVNGALYFNRGCPQDIKDDILTRHPRQVLAYCGTEHERIRLAGAHDCPPSLHVLLSDPQTEPSERVRIEAVGWAGNTAVDINHFAQDPSPRVRARVAELPNARSKALGVVARSGDLQTALRVSQHSNVNADTLAYVGERFSDDQGDPAQTAQLNRILLRRSDTPDRTRRNAETALRSYLRRHPTKRGIRGLLQRLTGNE